MFYYDSRSNLTCVRDPDLGLTYYSYDAGNRMTSVQNPFGEVTYYDYTPGGRMTKRVLGNDAVTYYSYDTIGRTTRVDNRKSDLSVISSFEYQRDAVGNPVSILREDGSVVYYEYDAKHQLTRETQRDDQDQDLYAYEWDYDAAGNREYQVFNGTATYYEYNAANELLTEIRLRQGFGGQAGADTIYYHYDGCGNTTAKQEASGTTYYQWDHENLMTRIDFPDGGHNYFAYDADSKRVEKRDSDGYTRFIYQGPDMLRLLLERDKDGDTQVHYTMGSGLEAMRRADGGDIASGASSFYHYDWLGSTFELTDADEAVTDTYRYNAWGEVLDRTGTTDNPHTYVGNQRYYAVPGAALMLLGVRYYGMTVGRFATRDPVAAAIYKYAGNVATSAFDPGGMEWYRAGPGMMPPNYPARVHPRSWWNTSPLPRWLAEIIEAAGGVARWFEGYVFPLPGPVSTSMFTHWLGNTCTDYDIDMEAFMAASSDERNTYRTEVAAAVRFIEGTDLRPHPIAVIVSDHAGRNAVNIESADWALAVGGHCGYGRAFVRREGACLKMQFVWHLEDTLTGYEKPGLGDYMEPLEKGGKACGFWINGKLLRTYEWSVGTFGQRYPDPLKQGGKQPWPVFG